jgi:hypothetical protein
MWFNLSFAVQLSYAVQYHVCPDSRRPLRPLRPRRTRGLSLAAPPNFAGVAHVARRTHMASVGSGSGSGAAVQSAERGRVPRTQAVAGGLESSLQDKREGD